MAKLLSRMGMESEAINGGQNVKVEVPPTRADILAVERVGAGGNGSVETVASRLSCIIQKRVLCHLLPKEHAHLFLLVRSFTVC
ncbi:hypothetical protein DPMN_130607 [Dreissena polymorpha]|uniref:Uncharacterized protein n=1 Tax=Dreissena polymorpha TaxID=45954 RepID=A0A9D4H4Z0_DREPO|nr:hypothetical protein DPMN_130607 [Dreissena polymorpha]